MTSTNSVSAVDLNGRGFPYCQTLSVTVTPNTPVGPVTTGAGTNRTQFRHPGIAVNGKVLEESDITTILSF